jgi:hypothetical protein
VSSNSSASSARRLLGAAFEVLRDEAPAHHEALCAALAELPVNLVVGADTFAAHVAAGTLVVAEPFAEARATVTTSLAATCALLEARHTLVAAIECGELDVRGSAAALDAAADAFVLFLHGLVRARSSAALFDELRREVASGGSHG